MLSDLFGMIFGSILGTILRLGIVLVVGVAVCIAYYIIAARAAAQEHISLFTVPTIPYLILYFLAIDIPMFGGNDWLGVKGIYAEHEILKLFIIGLPLFFFVTFYLMHKYGQPLFYSLIYSGVCWLAAVMACATILVFIALIGIYIITKHGTAAMISAATEQPTELVKECPNCHRQIAFGDSFCPHCGKQC